MNLTNGLAIQDRAKRRIPGLSQLLSKRPDRFSYGVWPAYFESAQGVTVRDLDGNRFIDMSIGGIGATVLGYQDPDVDGAVKEAIGRGIASSLNCPEEVELADLLCEIHPWADMVRFARCGGEAVAIAVRIARAVTGRDRVGICGYHGWHDWYLAANLGTENALGEHLISGLNPTGVPRSLEGTSIPFSYNDFNGLEHLIATHGQQLAAIVMEPTRGERPAPGFLERVRQHADSCGAVLVADEVSAGFRICCGGAHLSLGLTPDLAVFSKALGNGYPAAAIIGRRDVMEAAQTSFISSTNWTERTGTAAALATVRKFRRLNAHERLMAIGTAVQDGWRRMAESHGLGIGVGGIPPLSHFSFKTTDPLVTKAYFVQLMIDKGFLATNGFYAMYAHTDEHVAKYLLAIDGAFSEIARAEAAGTMRQLLRGAPAVAGFGRLA